MITLTTHSPSNVKARMNTSRLGIYAHQPLPLEAYAIDLAWVRDMGTQANFLIATRMTL